MKLSSCLHPLIVKNRFTGEPVAVPCGKCAACRSKRNSEWKFKLDLERQCWPYCFFFTLTYDDDHVPVMDYSLSDRQALYDYVLKETKYLSLEERSFNFSALNRWFDKPYYCSVVDAQKFIKLVRYYISQLNSDLDDEKVLRYYLVHEYGESTFRPHLHGLFFFRSEAIKTSITEIVYKSWKNGSVRIEPARDGATNYCASYLNQCADMPKMYASPLLRPRRQYSRRPPIGSLLANDSYIRKLFDTTAVSESLYSRSSGKFIDVPLRPFLKNRLYPKIKGFDSFSHYDRSRLYATSFGQTFDNWLSQCLEALSDESSSSWFSSLIRSYVRTGFDDDQFVRNCLYRLYCVSKRVVAQAAVFGLSVDQYVCHIEKYYDKCAQYNLKQQYLFQADYVRSNPPEDLIAQYPLFLADIVKGVYTDAQFSMLILFGYDLDKDFSTAEIHTLDSSRSFQKFQLDTYWREFNNSKTKHFKEYFREKYMCNF